jgi:Nitroreductase
MRTAEETAAAVRAAVEAAVWAPSVHNTQPWSFAVRGDEIDVFADPERRLPLQDPAGREMLISIGAAVLNIRLSLAVLGYEPVVRLLPDPDRPALLATVRLGAETEPGEHTRMLHEQIPRRRTHRGAFLDVPIPRNFADALAAEARAEGARLTPVRSEAGVRVLAAVTRAAQEVQEQDRALCLEVLRWARPPGTSRGDGVPPEAYPRRPDRTEPDFPQRHYSRDHLWGYDRPPAASPPASPGLVAVLSTVPDTPEEWLRAGQALQRVLLFAAAHGVRAAFHTQALEMHHLREFVREELLDGEYPQMIMRLGITGEDSGTLRRPLAEVFAGAG